MKWLLVKKGIFQHLMGKIVFILPSRWQLTDIYRWWFNSVFSCSKEADQEKCLQRCVALFHQCPELSHVLGEGSSAVSQYWPLHCSLHPVMPAWPVPQGVHAFSSTFARWEQHSGYLFCHRCSAVLKYSTDAVILFILYRGMQVPRLKLQRFFW